MADHLERQIPKRQKLDPLQGTSDSSDIVDLENNLPDELMSSVPWELSDNVTNPKPPAQDPGTGTLQNEIENPDNSDMRQMQISHVSSQGNKGLVCNATTLGGQLSSESPNLQSPPNVSVRKVSVVSNLPSSIPDGFVLPTMDNNGSPPQVMSSIHAHHSMNTASNLAGEGLNTRATLPHVAHSLGSRMQSPSLRMLLRGNVSQGASDNSAHNHYNPSANPQVSAATGRSNIPTHVGKPALPQSGFDGPAGPSVPLPNNVSGETVTETHPPAASPVQSQSTVANLSPANQTTNPSQSTTLAPSANAHNLRAAQRQLALLLHAHQCPRRESQLIGEVMSCKVPLCNTMKNLLNHTDTCQANESCTTVHCKSSKFMIDHWKRCVKNDCRLCLPLKQRDVSVSINTPQNTQSPNAPATDMRRAYDALAIQCPTTGANIIPAGFPPNPFQSKSGRGLPLPTGSSMSSLSGNIDGVGVLTPSQVQSATYVTLPLGSDFTAGSAPNNAQQNINVMSGLTDTGGQNLITQMPGGLQADQVTANPVQVIKEWHQSVTPGLRNHLVDKLVQAIFPTSNPRTILDRRIHNLVVYARKVEGELYEMANSLSEYYHSLAEKIYKIQKELEEKRQKRTEQHLQQQSVQPQNQRPARVQTSLPLQLRLRSNSPAVSANLGGIGVLNQSVDRPLFPLQTNAVQSNQQTVGISRQSPNTNFNNAVLSPFVQNVPSSSNTSTALFPVTCNNSVRSPQTSPCANQIGQLNETLESQQQQSSDMQSATVNINYIPIQTPTYFSDTITTAVRTPKSVGSATGPSPTASKSLQPSSSAEMVNLNTSKQSSISSQMVATTAALDRDEEFASHPYANTKGNLKTTIEDSIIKSEEQVDCDKHNESENNIKNDVSPEIKEEMKTQTAEDSNIPSQSNDTTSAKDVVPNTSSTDIKIEADLESSVSLDKKQKKYIFKPDELRQKLMPTLDKLFKQDPESHPFRQPIDPQTLGIPDYFDIVKRPMDLSTIKRNLDTGQYSDPWEYIEDVWLMFENAWLYNKKTSKTYRYCTKLAEIFEQEIDHVMQSMGYCCGRKYTFNPQLLCCYGKQHCTIPKDGKYYSYQSSLQAYGLGSSRYTFCQKCFNKMQGDTVTLGDDPTQAQTAIKKNQFKEMNNDRLEKESFVNCTDCNRKLHKICVLHNQNIWPQGFTCEECLKTKGQKRKENKFNAKRLPPTNLSIYIETRVNVFLKKNEAGAGQVHIRVVSSSEKVAEVKPGMQRKYVETGEMPREFPYRAKALFAFQEIDGVDVCFFGMHVQEYGSECPAPNTRRVYIAYLDSVHFFKPRQYRTAVYYEILLGYMDYVKKLGFTMAHIWACPPSEGDDYIFHCHPAGQKIPKPKRLQDWYKKMLDKGIIERVVFDYNDILKQAMEDNLRSVADLPYFEGDFWPTALEQIIKELDQEEEEKRKRAVNAQVTSLTEENEAGQDGEKKGVKKAKKSNKSKANQRRNSKRANVPQTGNDLSAKVFAMMEKHKDVFFVIRLQSLQTAASYGPIHDPDPIINSDLMDGRDPFLALAREKHYEFSSLRRATYSTMSMLYELHNQGRDKFVYTCNNCEGHVETRYHCSICDDFDLCIECYEKDNHPHKMDKLGLDLDNGSPPSDTKVNPNDVRKLSIQRCIQSLVHASQCRDANCRLTGCLKMKRVISHTKDCKRKINNGCPICKQLIALCCYHAKNCQDTKCSVLFCPNIKHKLKQQQLHQRLQQAQLLRRRMAVMNTRTAAQGTTLPGTPVGTGTQSVMPVGINPINSTSPATQNSINMHPSHQPVICLQSGTQTPPANVLQAVDQVQEEAARQQVPHVSYGKVNPNSLTGQNMPPPPFQRTLPHLGINYGGNLFHMEQRQPRYNTAPLRQHSPQLMQPQGLINQGPMFVNQQSVRPGNAGLNSAGNVMKKPTLQQLMQVLKSPRSPEQQQQILLILKSNPELMAACIKRSQQTNDGVSGSEQQQQFQHTVLQLANSSPHQTRVPIQGSILNQPSQSLAYGPTGQLDEQRPPFRPLSIPRSQPVPSPRGPCLHRTTSQMFLGQNHAGPSQDNNEEQPMTPQDQLSKFVEQL